MVKSEIANLSTPVKHGEPLEAVFVTKCVPNEMHRGVSQRNLPREFAFLCKRDEIGMQVTKNVKTRATKRRCAGFRIVHLSEDFPGLGSPA